LNNPWTGRGSCTSKIQWTGSIRIHDLGRRLCDHDPDDECEDSDAVGDNGRVGKGDRNHGQGTSTRGCDNNRNYHHWL
jgi:hypothetical protein